MVAESNDNGMVNSRWLILDSIPPELEARYGAIPNKILVRKCYEDLYEAITAKMLNPDIKRGTVLCTGTPGIGKSIFMIYFICRHSLDDRFADKRYALELDYCKGYYYRSTNDVGEYFDDVPSSGYPPPFNAHDNDLIIFSDIKEVTESRVYAKWLLIFSDPHRLRYKYTIKKFDHVHKYTLPTWSFEELRLADPNVDSWYHRFVKCGGVAKEVLWSGHGDDPARDIDNAIETMGPTVADNLKGYGFALVDDDFTLVHINPTGRATYPYDFYSFASDYVFRKLEPVLNRSLLRDAAERFNEGPLRHGEGTDDKIFEQMCLWYQPLAGRILSCEPLGHGQLPLGSFTLPALDILSRSWKEESQLMPNVLYQPAIANMDFGNAFCVMKIEEEDVLVVLQMTSSETHPIKADGLTSIFNAYAKAIRVNITRRIIIFVTPLIGELKTLQPLHMRNNTVYEGENHIPPVARKFEQWVYRYRMEYKNKRKHT